MILMKKQIGRLKNYGNNLEIEGLPMLFFYVTAEEIAGSADVFIHAPETLLNAQPVGRPNVETCFFRINLETNRPLHAKAIQLRE